MTSDQRINPYESPTAPVLVVSDRGPPGMGSIGFLSILTKTSEAFTDHLGTFLALGAVQFLAVIVFYFIVILIGILSLIAKPTPDVIDVVISWGFPFIIAAVFAWLLTGIVRVALPMLRGESYSSISAIAIDSDTVQVLILFLPVFELHALATSVWYHYGDLLIADLFWFAAGVIQLSSGVIFALAPAFIVDRKMWLLDAVAHSFVRIAMNLLSFGLSLLLLVFMLSFASLFTLGFGTFLLMPIVGTFLTLAYFQSTGERTVRPDLNRAVREGSSGGSPKIAPPPGFGGERESTE